MSTFVLQCTSRAEGSQQRQAGFRAGCMLLPVLLLWGMHECAVLLGGGDASLRAEALDPERPVALCGDGWCMPVVSELKHLDPNSHTLSDCAMQA